MSMRKPDYLGEFEVLILLALLRLHDHAHGAAIWRELQKKAKRTVVMAAIYTTLDRLQNKGYVTSSWSMSEGVRPKKLYAITDSGHKAVERSLYAVNEMQAGLNLGFSPK